MGYNDHKGHSQLPGVSDAVEQVADRKFHYGEAAKEQYDGVRIHKDTDDEDQTVTSKLMPGLVLAKVITGDNEGMYVDLDHSDAPANGDLTDVVILDEVVDLLDKTGTRQNCQAKVLALGHVVSSELGYNDADGTRQAAAKAKAKLIRFV